MSALESDPPSASMRPYLIRALYEWCADNGLTPYIVVRADETVQAPREYVQGGEIVLNISADATSALALDNDYIRFRARFGGVAREIIIPVNRVLALYARESGQGMAFDMPAPETAGTPHGAQEAAALPGEDEELTRNPYLALAERGQAVKDFPDTVPSGIRGGIQLVPNAPAAPGSGDNDTPPTPAPPHPRPALKRVK